MFKISKSDYVLGVKCPNAIWFKKLRKDIQTEMNMAILERGTAIGELQHASYLPFMSCSWNALLSFCLMFGFVLAKPEKK